MIRKMVIVCVAAAAVLLTGCARGRTGATLEVDLSQSYACEEVEMQGMRVYAVGAVNGGAVMSHTKGGLKPELRLYFYNTEDGSFTQLEGVDSARNVGGTVQLPDGRFGVMYNVPDKSKPLAERYDGKLRVLAIYNKDLELEEERWFPDEVPAGWLSDGNLVADQEGNWYYYGTDEEGFGTLYILNEDLTLQKSFPSEKYAASLALGSSGQVYQLSAGLLYKIDAEAGKLVETGIELPGNTQSIMNGYDYELYFSSNNSGEGSDGIYGMNADGSYEKIVDYANSDLPGSIFNVMGLPDGTFFVWHNDNEYNDDGYFRLRPRTEEEQQVEVISLAGVGLNPQLVREVCQYNRSQTERRIVMKDYNKDYPDTGDDYEPSVREATYVYDNTLSPAPKKQALEDFKNDLLSGTVPDIIAMDHLPVRQLANKGLLTDMAPMLEEDERFDEEDFYMNLIDGMKMNGKLNSIGFSFIIRTAMAKTEFVGMKQGRSPEEYLDMLQSTPEGMHILPVTSQEAMVDTFLTGSQGAFIDRNSATCSFDSEGFVRLLELTAAMQSSDEMYTNDEDYWNMVEFGYDYQSNHTLLDIFQITKPITYHEEAFGIFGRTDVTLVGYPESSGGNGGRYQMNYTLAITSQSKELEPVWDWFMEELGTQKQSKVCPDGWGANSLPLRRSTMANCLKAATQGAMRSVGNANEVEMQVLADYIEHLRMYYEQDSFITNIITEEAEKCFAGDQTAEQAAQMIQSRCTLYLSELQ